MSSCESYRARSSPRGVTRRNLVYMGARKLGFQEHGFVDAFALRELLKRWNLSMGVSPVERRIALRMSRQEQALMTAAGYAVIDYPSTDQ